MPIYTGSGSALSTTGSTSHMVYMDDVIVQVQNQSDANYSVMKEWTASTSGPFTVKFTARNRPGTYYWAYIVYNATKSTVISPNGSGNANNNCRKKCSSNFNLLIAHSSSSRPSEKCIKIKLQKFQIF